MTEARKVRPVAFARRAPASAARERGEEMGARTDSRTRYAFARPADARIVGESGR